MPLCPQITNTPITVSLTADFTVTNVLPVLAANTEQLTATNAAAAAAQATATSALANAAVAYNAAIGSLQPSANTIVNASNQMTAINGTGITVFSGASATTGARVVLNSLGLAGFDSTSTGSSNGATFSISATTGAAVFKGSITGSDITGSTLNISGNCIIDASGFLTATGATITGTINSTVGNIGGFTINSTSLTGSGGFTLSSTGQIDGGNANSIFYGFANIGGGSATGERLIVTGTSALNGNTGVLGNLTVTNSCTFGAVTQQFEFLSSTGNVRVASTYGNSVSGRSMQISSAGLYGTTASTLRKKHEIQSYKIDSNALLNLDVKTFKYKPEIDEAQTVQYGFIAEEAQELGLNELIQYDSTGIPDYFAYEKLPIFLLQLIQELKAEINQLKGE